MWICKRLKWPLNSICIAVAMVSMKLEFQKGVEQRRVCRQFMQMTPSVIDLTLSFARFYQTFQWLEDFRPTQTRNEIPFLFAQSAWSWQSTAFYSIHCSTAFEWSPLTVVNSYRWLRIETLNSKSSLSISFAMTKTDI